MGKVFNLGQTLEKEAVIEPSNRHDSEQEPKVVKAKSTALSFPYRIMTGAAGNFADIYKDYLETPEVFLFMSYLNCLGIAVSKKLTIASELKTQPRLFIFLVGETARDRKSTSINITTNLFEDVVEDFHCCHGVGSAEGLQKLLEKNESENRPGTIITVDEMKALVDKCKIHNSVLLPCLSTLFESNKYQNYTKHGSIDIKNAHISILGASTLATYQRIYDSSFIDIGFPNRVFLVVGTAKRRFSIPDKIPQKEVDQMRMDLNRVIDHVGDDLELIITEDAKALYHDWYMKIPDSIHARRLDGYAIRFMMLLSINSLKREIDVETMEATIVLMNWQFEIRRLHDPIDADTIHARLEESIRRALKKHGGLKNWELKRRINAKRVGLWFYKTAIDGLVSDGEIIFFKDNKYYLPKDLP